MGLVLFVTWTRAPEVDQTAKTSGHELMERLQQCQRERQEVILMLHTVTQVGQQDDRSWIESSEFCLQLNSSLAVIRDPAEMEFIQGVMSRFPLPLPVGGTDGCSAGGAVAVGGRGGRPAIHAGDGGVGC
ncbi:C-type lectin domain family 5 member A [Dissostichus eleginoides]|uniref:C-type lectin domain family 5 member A n=1 Tax=Dissostichus eleginoides TaxID=100907 RepID=A0AAD9F920_DISEL|nr:C-type lectin domain family 5 member A [Dissostichus eleginoides]